MRTLSRVLIESERNSTTIDLESVQATLGRNIWRILRKYRYPPDMEKLAMENVIRQAEMMAGENRSN